MMMSMKTTRMHRARAGQAMVITLIAIGFLAAVTGAVSVVLTSYSRMARYDQNRKVSLYLARSGLEAGAALLSGEEASVHALSQKWALESGRRRGELPTGEYGLGPYPDSAEEGAPAIVDHGRKLNINAASPAMLESLMPAIGPRLAERIVNRREVRPFSDIAELLDIEGMAEVLSQDAGGGLHLLEPMLTTVGSGKINVNTAGRRVLSCVEGISQEDAGRILERRRGGDGRDGTDYDRPFQSREEVRQLLGVDDEDWEVLEGWIEVRSSFFTVCGWGLSHARPSDCVELQGVLKRGEDGYKIIQWQER